MHKYCRYIGTVLLAVTVCNTTHHATCIIIVGLHKVVLFLVKADISISTWFYPYYQKERKKHYSSCRNLENNITNQQTLKWNKNYSLCVGFKSPPHAEENIVKPFDSVNSSFERLVSTCTHIFGEHLGISFVFHVKMCVQWESVLKDSYIFFD